MSAFTRGSPLEVGDLLLDPQARQVARVEMALNLTAREFDLPCSLMRHAGKVVPHRLVLSEVWGPDYGVERQYLRVFVNRLRRKIEVDSSRPCRILTEMGVGYRLVHSSCAA
jgi:two-component system, OmpR family, KDP operon response regulator KdpE